MSKKKIKIGITGNLGSGKSEFSRIAKLNGYTVINSDQVSKELLSNDIKVRELVIKNFGSSSYSGSKTNTEYLSKKVFNNPEQLAKLESILHPRVLKEIDAICKKEFQKKDTVFIESALIYEADIESIFDYVVLITASIEIRRKRKLEQGMTEKDFIERENSQIPEEEKKKRADFIFSNEGSKTDLESKFKLLSLTLGIEQV